MATASKAVRVRLTTRIPAGAALDYAALLLFTAIAGVTACFHEPWADEAQAWLIARDLGIQGIVKQMGYEGSPPLWHLLLWFLARLHLPYACLGVVSVLLMSAAMYLWLRRSPLPAPVRLLIPFAFYYQYQYAVVARSYALSTLLAFAAATLWRARPVRPVPLAIVLALLAQTNMHGFTIAMGIAAALAWESVRDGWKTRPSFARLIQFGIGGTLILGSALIARGLASPYADCSFKAAVQLHKGTKLGSITSAFDGVAGFSRAMGINPSWMLVAVLAVAIALFALRKGAFVPFIIATALLFAYPITTGKEPFGILQGVILLALILSWFIAVKNFVCVFPFLLTVLAMGWVWSRPWHYGMALTAFLVSLWGAWPAETPGLNGFPTRALAVSLVVLGIWQLPSTAQSVYSDIHEPYSGAKATAEFLAPYIGHRRIYCINFYGTALQPYFDKNIFANWSDAYWTWSNRRAYEANRILDDVPSANAIIVVPVGGMHSPKPPHGSPAATKLAASGFHKTKEFCGAQFWLGKVSEYECYDIYQKKR